MDNNVITEPDTIMFLSFNVKLQKLASKTKYLVKDGVNTIKK